MAISLVNSDFIAITGPTSNSTTIPLAIPTGSFAPSDKDLIVWLVASGVSNTFGTPPAGYSIVAEQSVVGASHAALIVHEFTTGDTDQSITMTSTCQYSQVVGVFRPSSGNRIFIDATAVEGTSTNANPPSHTPAFGTATYTGLAGAVLDGSSGGTITVAPSGYGTLKVAGRSSSTGAVVALSYLSLGSVSSEDPGTFTSNNEQWMAVTALMREYSAGYTLTAASGSFALTGQTTGLTAARTLTAAQATFALTGQAATLQKGFGLTAGSGSFALTGVASGLGIARYLAAGVSTFTLTGRNANLSYSADQPATLPFTPTSRYHPDFSTVTLGGDSRVTSISDLMGLADASASAGDGPLEGSDSIGGFWRFQASQWLTVATALGLNSRDFSIFAVAKPKGYGNNGFVSIGVNGASPPNVGGAIARVAQGGTGYAPKPLVASRQAFSEKILVGEQLQVIGWTGRSTGIYTTVNGEGNGAASIPTAGSGTGAEIGRNANSPSATYLYGDLYELVIFDAALSDANHVAVAEALCDYYGIPYTLANTLAADGDSIMQGQGIDYFAGMMQALTDVDSQYYQQLDTRVINGGIGGSGWTKAAQLNPTTRRDTAESFYADDRQLTGDRTLFLMCGRNDVDDTSASADAIYADYVGFLNTTTTGLLQRGWKVIVGVNISGGASIDGGINQLRSLLLDPQFLIDCDAGSGGTYEGKVVIEDLPSITYSTYGTVFDSNTDSTDTDIYQDGTHPTTLGNLLMLTGGDTPQYGFYAGLSNSYSLTASVASFAVSGQSAGLIAARTLTAAQASYALTGNAANLPVARYLSASGTSYALTCNDAAFFTGKLLVASTGAYSVTGQDVALSREYRLSAAQVSFSVSGQAVGLLKASTLAASTAAFSLSGQSASFAVGRALAAGHASFALTGQNVTFTASGPGTGPEPPASRRFASGERADFSAARTRMHYGTNDRSRRAA